MFPGPEPSEIEHVAYRDGTVFNGNIMSQYPVTDRTSKVGYAGVQDPEAPTTKLDRFGDRLDNNLDKQGQDEQQPRFQTAR